MAFPERFLDELISRNDIADVVGSYVQLTKRSGSNMFGLCPFHSEKTPSFSVSRDKQIYHCFGCGKGGSVINFVMEIENLSFPDAVHFLAKRAGMTVPEDETDDRTYSQRARLLALNSDAARFFYDNLKTPQGAAAVEYINKREISAAMVKRFGLGFAPDSWNSLIDAMLKKGYTAGEMLSAGLAKKGKTGGIYDTFRNRLVFPVIDVRGSVIGFSGRILGDGEPKYLNSPDTLVFNKGKNLFAMNIAKKTKQGMIILAEGNIDVVSLHQAGFDCAVASLGTALTPDQARLIARYTSNVVIAYDSDEAGTKASQRAIGILEKTGLNVKVLRMSGAKDPDEYIKKRGADAFALLLDKSENHIEYRLLTIQAKHALDTDEGRIGFLTEATQLLSELSNAVEREVYGTRVAELTGVSKDAVLNEVGKAYRRNVSNQKRKQERENTRPTAAAQPKERTLRYDNFASANAEEGIIRLLMLDPSLLERLDGFDTEDFTSPFLAKTFEAIKRRYFEGRAISASSMTYELEPAEMSQLTVIMQKPEKLASSEQALGDYIEKIRTEQMKAQKADLREVGEKYRKTKGYGG